MYERRILDVSMSTCVGGAILDRPVPPGTLRERGQE